MLRQRKYCRDTAPLLFAFIIVATELRIVATVFFSFFFGNVATWNSLSQQRFYFYLKFSLDFVATYCCWLRHSSFGLEIVSRHKKTVTIETATFSTFLPLFCLFSLLFQLTHAKHKVGEYSIIWHKNRSETVKNMS